MMMDRTPEEGSLARALQDLRESCQHLVATITAESRSLITFMAIVWFAMTIALLLAAPYVSN